MRVAYYYSKSCRSLDTAKLNTMYDYELAHNLYSRLVEYNSENQLVPGVAESFSFKDDSIEFRFGDKVTTVDGHTIGARDAAISLKRLVMAGESGHGDIRRLLCPGHVLKSIHEDCPGIQIIGNSLVLKPVKRYYVSLLMSVLESADFSIVPESSLDLKVNGAPIIDWRNTSGPYYVEKDSDDGSWILKANKKHYHYDQMMPQTVQLVPTSYQEGSRKLVAGEVDLVTTTDYFTGSEAEGVLKDHKNYNVHATLPFRINMLCFTPEAVKKFSIEQRVFVAKKFAEVANKLFPTIGAQSTAQFFQALSDGSLTREQLDEIGAFRENVATSSFGKSIEIGVREAGYAAFLPETARIPGIRLLRYKVAPFGLPLAQRTQMYNVATDSAWSENLALLGHNFKMGIFHLPGLDSEQWFTSYLETGSKEGRIKKLNELHYQLLKMGVIYPYDAYPYYAVANKSWSLNFSKLSSNTDLWRMRRN